MRLIEQSGENRKVRIKQIEGGKKIREKLEKIGIHEGDCVLIVQNLNRGPLILQKNEIRIALGKGIAQSIYVEEVLEDSQ